MPPGSTAPAPFYRFRRITLPLMRLSILIAVVRLLIHFVNVLTFALILTGGGPNGATQTTGLALYRLGFIEFRLGEANALAVLVFLFNLVLVAVQPLAVPPAPGEACAMTCPCDAALAGAARRAARGRRRHQPRHRRRSPWARSSGGCRPR